MAKGKKSIFYARYEKLLEKIDFNFSSLLLIKKPHMYI